jgi:hypothetical protein
VHHFVVVASRPATAIGQRTVQLLADPAPPCLSFAPQEHVHWSSSNGLVHVGSWSTNELVPPTMGTADDGIVAVGGQPIVTQPTDEAALLRPEVVARHAHVLRMLTERLDGPYAVVAIGPNGSGTIVSDPFGLHPIYHGCAGSVSVVSNSAALVAAVLERVNGRCPDPDEDAVAWLLLNGQMFGDATPYRGVRRLPFGSGAVLEPDGEVSVLPWHEPPWHRIDARSVAFNTSIDDAEQRMIATIRAALAVAPGAVSSELTAGKDSRLILELAARAGVTGQLRFCTYGAETSPDSEVAAAIADRLGLRHETTSWPVTPAGPTVASYVARVRNVSAQIACWESSTPSETEGITLSGLAGESLRTNYPGNVGLTTVEAAVAGFENHRFGRYHYVRGPALQGLRERARQLFLAPLETGARPEDLFDIFYVQHRLRRWIGDKPDRYERYVFPLYSPFAVQVAMAAGWEARAGDAIHEEIRRRADLPIGQISFRQGTRWRSRDGSSAMTEHAADRPIREASAPTLRFLKRQEFDEARKHAIREAVEFDRTNPAFELVDPSAMLADADRYRELDRRQQIELHQALTVVLWLGLARPDRAAVAEGTGSQ